MLATSLHKPRSLPTLKLYKDFCKKSRKKSCELSKNRLFLCFFGDFSDFFANFCKKILKKQSFCGESLKQVQYDKSISVFLINIQYQ